MQVYPPTPVGVTLQNYTEISIPRRLPAEGYWWARQDSNLQPDRYERSALTIELQAPAPG